MQWIAMNTNSISITVTKAMWYSSELISKITDLMETPQKIAFDD